MREKEKITLRTTNQTLETLHELSSGRRTKIRVDAEALEALILDHHAMFTALKKIDAVREPSRKPKRVRL